MLRTVLALALLLAGTDGQTIPKNLIFMISDGYGVPEQTLTRLTMERLNLNDGKVFMDEIFVAQAKTSSYDKLVTESAAAATALSCGLKTNRSHTGVDHNDRPCQTLLEAFRDKGYKTGTISTSRIQDATPASFTAHAVDRNIYDSISIQQVYGGFDLLLGGGMDFLTSNRTHKDGRNIYREASEVLNITTVDNAIDFRAVTELPLLGVFSQGHMSQEIDRNNNVEPSLLEMTQKAIGLLHAAAEAEGVGFMIMVEGSNIDKRWHECDSVGAQHDALIYDDTLRWVTEWAKQNNETLVISTSDHECGGVAIGNVWDTMRQDIFPEVFGQADHSALWMSQQVMGGDMTIDQALEAGLSRLAEPITESELAYIKTQLARDATVGPEFAEVDVPRLSNVIAHVVNKRVNIGCLSGRERIDHSGENVPIFGYGPGIEEISGVMENSELALRIARIFNMSIGVDAYMGTVELVPLPEPRPRSPLATLTSAQYRVPDVVGPVVPDLEAPGLSSGGVAGVIVGGIALIALLAAGWRLWSSSQTKRRVSSTSSPLVPNKVTANGESETAAVKPPEYDGGETAASAANGETAAVELGADNRRDSLEAGDQVEIDDKV